MLFDICLDFVMRKTTQQTTVGVRWFNDERLSDLDFADNIALIAEDKDGSQKGTIFNEKANMIGFRISESKSKAMSIGQACMQVNVNVENAILENVDKFTYLGSTVTYDGDIKRHVCCRLQKLQMCSEDSNNMVTIFHI
ncbi:hypothetical protein V3C99_011999 [Haemonchus contortus]|uniref:TerD domain-containing protein n=1 Tax=Haemonchus contortus TaxID=6289 RepID=A0A7I5E7L5_HAECO